MTRPIVQWAGGKGRLLDEILPRVPDFQGTYHEPFVGGAAVFFALEPNMAVLSDVNDRLTNLYRNVRRVPVLVAHAACALLSEHSKEQYLAAREEFNGPCHPLRETALFLYLNRTCFNGLYRENRKGEFNVPVGSRKDGEVPYDYENLFSASEALQHADVRTEPFDRVLTRAKAGDFVYFDPPYFGAFTGYAKGGFGPDEQQLLADVFDALTERGVACMLSNSDCPETRALYAKHRVEGIVAPRTISRNGAGRTKAGEIIVTNY